MPHHLTADMTRCIEECRECEQLCLETIEHCLSKGGDHVRGTHLTTIVVCADICATSARVMAIGSKLHTHTCQACAEICERCAAECERFNQDDVMKRCAEVCRRCAESCRQMARAGV